MATEAGSGRPFLGRVEIVESLYRQLEDTRAGTGGVTLLVGEAAFARLKQELDANEGVHAAP